MKQDNASNRNIANDKGAVQFPCPANPSVTIVRSKHSRQIGAKWVCPETGFEGP